MAGYDPKGKRAKSAKPADDGSVPMDAMLNATGEHTTVKVDPNPTPPEGIDLSDLESTTLPPAAKREGKRNTESSEVVVVDPTEVEPVDVEAATDPGDPTPPEAPLPDDELPSAPARREPLVPAAAAPDEDDRRLLIAALVALILALIGGLIVRRRRTP